MPRIWSFLIFFAVIVALLTGAHYYIWARLIRDTQPPPAVARLLTWTLVGLCVSIPAALIVARSLPSGTATAWVVGVFAWLGALWLLFVAVVLVDGIRVGLALADQLNQTVQDPSRRLVVNRLLGLAAVALGGGAALFSLIEGGRFRVKRQEVSLSRLPPELDGMTIVQLSDVHVGPTIGRAFTKELVARCNALEADAIVVTGDLVDGSVADLTESVAPLAQLKSRHGTFFVTGNHDYYSGADEWCEHLTSLGWCVLRNQHTHIGPTNSELCLAGVEDFSAGRFDSARAPDLRAALLGRKEGVPVILLAHQPKAAYEAQQHGVDLQLSGHTHGGQLWPFGLLVKLQQPVVSGLERLGDLLVYVSNGTGYWGPPMRLGAPAEITQLVLRHGKDA